MIKYHSINQISRNKKEKITIIGLVTSQKKIVILYIDANCILRTSQQMRLKRIVSLQNASFKHNQIQMYKKCKNNKIEMT